MLNRRNLLKAGTVVGAAALVPWGRLSTGGDSADAAVLADLAPAEPFTQPMPVPPVLQPVQSTSTADVYRLSMAETQVEIVKGVKSTVRAFGGSFPGPTIKARSGRRSIVRQTNGLTVNTAVHLHGGHVPSAHDGLPMAVIAPGSTREYQYPNRQVAASLWYHDHAHHLEAENVYKGLHGAYLVSDAHERSLPLPKGQYDVPLLIRDARVEADGTLRYTRPSDCPNMLVNGKERPYFAVAGRRYRFRLYNISVNRHLTLRFADGAEFTQIATDGGLLAAPVTRNEITLSGAERAEIVVDFSRYRPGTSVTLQNTAALSTETADVLRFDITRSAEDPSSVPARLATLPPVPTATVQREFTLVSYPDWTINGQKYDPARVDVETTVGSSEIWTIRNGDEPVPPPNFHIHHSFHTHLVQFRVLDRNGVPVEPGEAGLKDTVTIAPGDTVRIAMTWGDYPGEYVYHCHQLAHSSTGQMGRIDVKPAPAS